MTELISLATGVGLTVAYYEGWLKLAFNKAVAAWKARAAK